jgi:hypothetical protein
MEKQIKRLLKFSIFMILISFVFLTKTFAQPTAIYKVEKLYIDDVLQEGTAEEYAMELSIVRSVQDGFYYFSNEWTEIGSYSTGKMLGWEEIDDESAFNFDEEVDNVQAYAFKWKYENNYNRDHGVEKVYSLNLERSVNGFLNV